MISSRACSAILPRVTTSKPKRKDSCSTQASLPISSHTVLTRANPCLRAASSMICSMLSANDISCMMVFPPEHIDGRFQFGRQQQRAQLLVLFKLESGLLPAVFPVAEGKLVAAADDDIKLHAGRREHVTLEIVLRRRPRTDDHLRGIGSQCLAGVEFDDPFGILHRLAPAVVICCS